MIPSALLEFKHTASVIFLIPYIFFAFVPTAALCLLYLHTAPGIGLDISFLKASCFLMFKGKRCKYGYFLNCLNLTHPNRIL